MRTSAGQFLLLILSVIASSGAIGIRGTEGPRAQCAVDSPRSRATSSSPFVPVRARVVRHLGSYAEPISGIDLSPDGKHLLIGFEARKSGVCLCDVNTGEEIRRFEGHTEPVTDVAFLSDGRHAVSCASSGEHVLRLWDLQTGQQVGALPGPQDHLFSFRSLSCSPHGEYVAAGADDGFVRMWHLGTRRIVRSFRGPSRREGFWKYRSVVFSPDGRRILAAANHPPPTDDGADHILCLWDVRTGWRIRAFRGHVKYIRSVAFLPDGAYAVSGSIDETVRLWNLETGHEVRRFSGIARPVTSVASSPDGRFVAGGSDSTVQVWDTETGQKVCELRNQHGWVLDMEFLPDGQRLITAQHKVAPGSDGPNRDDIVLLWELEGLRQMQGNAEKDPPEYKER